MVKNYDDAEYLSNEDKELFVRIYQELQFIHQKMQAKEICDATILVNIINSIADSIKNKSKHIHEMSELNNSLAIKSTEMENEIEYLKDQLAQKNKEINSMIAENEEILDNEKRTIKEKSKEIVELKTKINEISRIEEVRSLAEEIKETNEHNTSTNVIEFHTPPRSANNSHPPQTNEHNKNAYFSSPENSSPENSIFYTTRKSTNPKQYQTEGNNMTRKEMEAKILTIEKNIEKILHKIQEPSQLNVNTKRNTSNLIQEIEKQTDILIIGDKHATNLKPTLEKKIPNNLHIMEYCNTEITLSDISTLNEIKTLKCKHLILVAGSNDIQKTPKKLIKQAINIIAKQFANSTIHLIQIPDRYDNVNLNFHINSVNKMVFDHIKKYKHIVVYKPQELIQSWDYENKIEINRNGKIKICNEISKAIRSFHRKYQAEINQRSLSQQKYQKYPHRNQYYNSYYYQSSWKPKEGTKENKNNRNVHFKRWNKDNTNQEYRRRWNYQNTQQTHPVASRQTSNQTEHWSAQNDNYQQNYEYYYYPYEQYGYDDNDMQLHYQQNYSDEYQV
jgi:Uncharacterized conserved protein